MVRVETAIRKANNSYGSDNWAVISNTGIEMYSMEMIRYGFDPLIGAFVIPNKSVIPHLATSIDTNSILLNIENLRTAKLDLPRNIIDPELSGLALVTESYKNKLLTLIDSELFVYIDNQGEAFSLNEEKIPKVLKEYFESSFNNQIIKTAYGDISFNNEKHNHHRKKIDKRQDYYKFASEVHLKSKTHSKKRRIIHIGIRTTFSRIPNLKRLLNTIDELTNANKGKLDIKIHIAANNIQKEEFAKYKKIILKYKPKLEIDCFYVKPVAGMFPQVLTLQEIVKRIEDDELNFVWFVDDDDFVIPNDFNIIGELLNKDIIFIGDSKVFNEVWDKNPKAALPRKSNYLKTYKGNKYYKNVTGMNHIPICSVIYPLKGLKEILLNSNLKGGYLEDYAILLIAQKTYEVRSYPFTIAGISFHGNNTTTLINKYILNRSYTTFLGEIISESFIPSTFRKFMEKSRQKENKLLTTIHERNLSIIENQKTEKKNAEQELIYLEREAYLVKTIKELKQQNLLLTSRSWKFYRKIQLKVAFMIRYFDKFSTLKVYRKINTFFRVFKYLGFSGIALLLREKLGKTENYPIDKFVIDYLHWQRVVEPKLFKSSKLKKNKRQLTISIITPIWNISPSILNKTIDSVKNQTYKNWELCLYDDASTNSETLVFLEKLKGTSDKIKIKFGKKNLNISLSTNEALKMAEGDYVLFLDNDDMLSPNALMEITHRINQKPETDVVYYDEDIMLMNDLRVKPILKPDWSPETLDSTMHIAHATYRRSLVDKLGGMRKGFEGSQDYDLILRARDLTNNIEHISKVLYHWRRIPGSTADFYEAKTSPQETAIKALKESIKRRKLKAKVEKGLTAPSFRFKYKIEGNPLVSIIIPTRNMKKYLKRCIDSVIEKTNYKNYEIIIVNNQSNDENTLKYFEEIRSDKIRILDYDDEFNYSAINNFAVKQARGKHVLLLNNDTEVIDGEWLESMLEFSQHKEIGAVGALLYFPDDTIQHAGCAVGIGGVAGHFYKYSRMGEHHMNVSLDFPKIIHNVSAVTGACLMIKKALYLEVSGLEEKGLKVAFNDIDFCLKVLTKGYRNIYTPFATMYHYESKSRGYDYEDLEKQLRAEKEVLFFLRKWDKFLRKGDPYYNPNFTLKDEFGGLAD
jgi:glycosyltransferase involved in cell wall biosynthesis